MSSAQPRYYWRSMFGSWTKAIEESLLFLVRITSQLFRLAPSRGFKDVLQHFEERFSRSLDECHHLPRQSLLRQIVDDLFCSHCSHGPSLPAVFYSCRASERRPKASLSLRDYH
jgi:hypothetical protein